MSPVSTPTVPTKVPATAPATSLARRRHLTALVTLAVMALLLAAPLGAAAQDTWSAKDPVMVGQGLKDPVDFDFGRDGYAYFASLTTTEVHRVDLATGERDEAFAVVLPDAYWQVGTETGTFGLELDPDFAANGVMYVSYSKNESGEWTNVLSRVTLEDATGAATEEVLMTRPGGHFHNGGRVLIADDHLWWTTGDASNPFRQPPEEAGKPAQVDGDMRGKVLRLTLEGDPAPDNPWGDAAYTKGHRNVYGIAWDPDGKRMVVTENGNAKHDYAYLLAPGANYGWPECEGACDEPDDRYTDPIWDSGDSTVAPTGMAWFRGAFWFGTFNQGDVMRLDDQTGAWAAEKVHHDDGTEKYPPRVLDVEVGPDGASLWFSTWTELWRMDFEEDPDHPAVSPMADGPFWWNGTAHGASAGPEDEGDDETAPGTTGTLPAPAAVLFLTLIALGLVRARRDL